MRLLDLFCGAGGCSVGYARAGFDVYGVDIEPHPDYPFPLVVDDAMTVLADRDFLDWFHVVHASPPCPFYSAATASEHRANHPDLIGPVRDKLRAWGGPYVIENVPGAARSMDHPLLVCGGMFGLGARCRDGVWRSLRRHRLFESNVTIMSAGCLCDDTQKLGVYGTGGGGSFPGHLSYMGHPEEMRAALQIDWMTGRTDISDAIPPAYTQLIGEQLLAAIGANP